MKPTINKIKSLFFASLLLVGGVGGWSSCSNLEDDDHYNKFDSPISNSELKIVEQSSIDYIASRSDLSSMDNLFKQQGIYDMLTKKGQKSTILVVKNDHFKSPEGDADYVKYITNSHVSDIEISPANLENGTRLMMWHGKYVNVQKDELAQTQGAIVDHILFNNAALEEVIKTNDGYIYVISDMINTPTSLYDYINELPAEYSEFKEMVLASGGKVFDKENSKAIGVNDQGNTVYDSVFIYTNTFFESVGFDMNSESLTATMLLPSNDVIKSALDDAHARLNSWNMEREDSIIKKWILKTAFFSNEYTPAQLQATAEDARELKSIHSSVWRTDIQKVDAANPTQLSNGVVYNITKLHIPTNVLIYRMKDWFYLYENCSEEEKAEYFKMVNLVYSKTNIDVAAWTPLAGVWPMHEDRVLICKIGEDAPETGFQLDFTPIMRKINSEGEASIVPYMVPPGAYRLAMGFKQNQNLDIVVHVYANGVEIAKSAVVTLGTATTYHYDRGNTLSDTYPEGYDPKEVTAAGGSSKAGNYDTDGGPIINELVVPDVNGDGSPSRLTFRIECLSWDTQTSVTFNHWCLRPTVNNY